MKKIIFIISFLLIFIIVLFLFNVFSNVTVELGANDKEINNIVFEVLKDTGKEGFKWQKKVINKKEDINLLIKKINNINYKDSAQEPVNGMSIIIKYKSNKDYILVFSGDRVNINGKYFRIDPKEENKLINIYNDLNYEEGYFCPVLQNW